MNKAEDNVCPRCGGGVPNDDEKGAYMGALSRWDNLTEVCSACGVDEAILDLLNGSYRDGGEHLSPYNVERPWIKIPAEE